MEEKGITPSRRSVRVRIVDLHKGFNGVVVLKGVSLEVLPGEMMAIIGRSGQGKTVLLKHIIGLMTPDSGRVYVDEDEVTPTLALGSKAKVRIALVFQSLALFNSLTVGENVALALKENRLCPPEMIGKIVGDTLAMVGLKGKEGVLPSELSGGMKKRLAIARALATHPDLILYDEPTSELDPVTAETITQVILDLKKQVKTTSIVVSHDVSLCLTIADRVAMLHDGRIIEVGTPEEIRGSRNPLVQEFIKGIKA